MKDLHNCHKATIVFFLQFFALSLIAQNKLPNIIYIYADDLGYAEIGSYGQQKIKTPHLDKMAAEGMRFTQHYTSAPVCAPARCMLMTGKHAGHSFIRGNYELGGFPDSLEAGQMPLPEGTYTIPKMLKAAGYATGMMGKWGLGMHHTSGSPNRQGFDYYYGYLDQKQAHNFYPTHLWENDNRATLNNPSITVHKRLDSTAATNADFAYFIGNDYAPEFMTEKALTFIAGHKKEPFFLYLPYTIPHVSLQVPAPYVNKYLGSFEERPYYGQQGYASTRYPYSTYAGMISFLDDQVGKIMSALQASGLDENTLVMFSSDNGTTFAGGVNAKFFNSVDGLRGLKMEVFEGGIRMPFIARWPGRIKAGATSDLISVQYDLMATLAELTGQAAGNTDGISFLPTLLGNSGKQKLHDFLYFEYPENGGQIAIRMGKWKGVRLNVKRNPKSPWLLFNLEKDRNETTDIALMHPEIVNQLDAIVKREHECATVKDWEFVDPKFTINANQ